MGWGLEQLNEWYKPGEVYELTSDSEAWLHHREEFDLVDGPPKCEYPHSAELTEIRSYLVSACNEMIAWLENPQAGGLAGIIHQSRNQRASGCV